MIKSLHIKNIQSHKDSELEFSKGINCIIGSSNAGKSAILRSLCWVRYNRPLGTDTLLSHWAIDNKGNQSKPMEAILENENGEVIRRRTKTENQYIVNGEVLNVVKTDVPEQVELILRLSDTNIQRQQDSPFLLSMSSGEVARYFNKIVNLDVIDRILTNAETTRRNTVHKIDESKALVEKYTKKHEEYLWLDDVEKLIKKYKNVQSQIDEISSQIQEIQSDFEVYENVMKHIPQYEKIITYKDSVKNINDMNNGINSLQNRITLEGMTVNKFEKYQGLIYPDFTEQKRLITKINSIDVHFVSEQIYTIEKLLKSYETAKEEIKDYKRQIQEYKAQLPSVCPICGNPIDKDTLCHIKEL